MSNQVRKNPVKRAFSGLVGLPPEPEAAPAPAGPTEPEASPTPESVPPISKTTEFVDLALVCVDCNAEFLCTAEDQKNSSSEPLRCNSCRERHREIAEQSSKEVKTNAEKEAARQRARRRSKQEQLAEIKKRLKVPIAQVKAAAEARAKAIARPGSMNQGKYMTDAPTGKGELIPSGNIESIAASRGRSAALGSSTIDPETGEAYWPENDRQRVKPEGIGERDNEKTPPKKDVDGLPAARQKFLVKLNDVDREGVVRELAYEYVKEDESRRLCRLCQTFVTQHAVDHIETVHGDESEPTHDARFGDIIDAHIKRQERKEARLRRAGRDKALEVIADTKARAEAGATRAGYVKLNGVWVPKPRTG
jgi:hypothetical protein